MTRHYSTAPGSAAGHEEQDGERRPGVAAEAVSGFMLTAQAVASSDKAREKVGAGETAIEGETKP